MKEEEKIQLMEGELLNKRYDSSIIETKLRLYHGGSHDLYYIGVSSSRRLEISTFSAVIIPEC